MRWLLLSVTIWTITAAAQAPTVPMDVQLAEQAFTQLASSINATPVEAIPVTSSGRVKPLNSLAREVMLFISGSFNKFGNTALKNYLALAVSKVSQEVEIINLRSPTLRETLGFTKTKRFYSIRELEQSPLSDLAQPLIKKEEANSKSVTESEKEILEAYGQLSAAQQIISGNHLAGALNIAGQTALSDTVGEQLQPLLTDYFANLERAPLAGAVVQASRLREVAMTQPVPQLFERQMKNLDLEVWYTNARLFLWAAILYILAGTLLIFPRTRRALSLPAVAVIFALPAGLQIAGFGIRVYITSFAPVTSMYGTMLWVSLGVGLFSMLLYALYRNGPLVGILWIGSALILLLTESLPVMLNSEMDPIVAVLRSNYWLTIHVLTITISYAAFTITMLIGNAAIIRSLIKRESKAFFDEYAQYAYRMIQLGVFLLTVGIILGGIWADYSWGRFWGWDPKETWALIADVGYLAILHARYGGWIKSFGLLAACPLAYLLVVMAWYGVNFILASGLHSYGFSSGGALAVSIFVAAQMSLLVIAAVVRRLPLKLQK